MGEFLGYMFFSLIEGLAVFSLMFAIFRFDMMKYILPSMIVITIINLLSFFIREELSLVFISPVINLVLCICFLVSFLRIPIIWSMVMGISGYVTFAVLQNGIVFLSGQFLSIYEVQHSIWKGYLLQTLTGFIGIAIGWSLYRFGYGFAYEFEKLRMKREKAAMITVNLLFLMILAGIMYIKMVSTTLLILTVSLVVFLIYSLRREASENDRTDLHASGHAAKKIGP